MTNTRRVLVLSPDVPFRQDWLKAIGCSGFTPVLANRGAPAGSSDLTVLPYGTVELSSMRLRPSRLLWRTNAWLRGKALIALVDRLSRHGTPIDLVHSHFFAESTGLEHLVESRKIPYVVSEHSSALTRFNPEKAISRQGLKVARSTYERSAAVLPVSNYLADEIRQRGLPGRLTVVPNPVDTDLFHPVDLPTPARIITVSRLAKVKRVDLLLEAIARLAGVHPALHLEIVGDGPERRALQQLAIDLRIGELVNFRGQEARERLPELLSQASVFAMASYTENLPVAMLEASACGLPVVGPNHGGTADLIAAIPGETFVPGQVEDIAETLLHWIYPNERQRSESRRAVIENYSTVAVGQRLSTIYEHALREGAGSSKP